MDHDEVLSGIAVDELPQEADDFVRSRNTRR
jgi:hypothetical protein